MVLAMVQDILNFFTSGGLFSELFMFSIGFLLVPCIFNLFFKEGDVY